MENISQKSTEVFTHSCPNCGGALNFDPEDQKFHCPYCLSIFTEEEVSIFEENQRAAKVAQQRETSTPVHAGKERAIGVDNDETSPVTGIGDLPRPDSLSAVDAADEESAENLDLFSCPNCGAQIVTESTTAATTCIYCHSPVILTGRLSGEFLPEQLIPFTITKEEAEKRLLEWFSKKRFIPKGFINPADIQNLKGVYLPYYLVDSEVEGVITADGTLVRIWMAGDVEYTETKQYRVSRSGNSTFNEYAQIALKKSASDLIIQSIQPFDFKKMIQFKNQYLSGFFAEKRNIDFSELRPQIENNMKSYGSELLSETIQNYTTVTNLNGNMRIAQLNQSYALLPVWLITYRYTGENTLYFFAINGETGKTAGKLPIAKAKLALATSLLFISIFTIVYFLIFYITKGGG
ncbi:MAG: TFIIB-type zinc ribbon-containing protein [Streptococcaceae bacterium]|jgi:DNA-directed RNA polymerase subunit RPC12/RpoP|nr:TFIIB-type zinc ribbon-containing protein [Streptococcaceae bacterium]